MAYKVDARGLACPQPVLLTMEAIKTTGEPEIEILVDNQASRENVSRAAASQGWTVTESDQSGEDFRLLIKK
ncbi:sulfurtransferase TusA family protein [Desulfonatronovibrio hydrogenovorans]|uniref:sulfurtransferase TusA family protein n=1 Tax=Desulfonatronovibrio hydrogenovorans TaxID=53245 RepID=UPI00048D9E9E|nr:sulfurtransferase TusA family protein [Desulfonatronovibrio hydrogenovorans]